jgi:hypothetical protein
MLHHAMALYRLTLKLGKIADMAGLTGPAGEQTGPFDVPLLIGVLRKYLKVTLQAGIWLTKITGKMPIVP